ncbi:MAG: helix-turn-helix domain-containing protein [Thermoguttaceae bacterium]
MARKQSPRDTGEYVSLATQLLDLIAESGLTVNAVAVGAGVAQPILQRFVSGTRDNLRLDTIDKLCEFFGVRLTVPKRKPKK